MKAKSTSGIFAPLLMLLGFIVPNAIAQPAGGRGLQALRVGMAVVGACLRDDRGRHAARPVERQLGPVKISATQTEQPISIAILCLIILGATSATFVDAVRRRSIFAFYTVRRARDLAVLARSAATAARTAAAVPRSLRPADAVSRVRRAAAGAGALRDDHDSCGGGRGRDCPDPADGRRRRERSAWSDRARPRGDHRRQLDLRLPDARWCRRSSRCPPAVPASAAVLELPLGDVGPDIAAVYRSIGHATRWSTATAAIRRRTTVC